MTQSVKQMQLAKMQDRSEVAIQFEEIFKNHHDPLKRQELKIKENRLKRANRIKEDAGL